MAKQKKQTTNKSTTGNTNNGSQQIPLLANEIKFDSQIDIPNPKLQPDGTLTYTLFGSGSSSNIDISPAAVQNNAYYPELEKLSKKLNKTFKKKAAKYLLKKQTELNDTSIRLSIASANNGIFLTYTKSDAEKN